MNLIRDLDDIQDYNNKAKFGKEKRIKRISNLIQTNQYITQNN